MNIYSYLYTYFSIPLRLEQEKDPLCKVQACLWLASPQSGCKQFKDMFFYCKTVAYLCNNKKRYKNELRNLVLSFSLVKHIKILYPALYLFFYIYFLLEENTS